MKTDITGGWLLTILLFLSAAAAPTAAAVTSAVTEPDFAYPVTVAKDSRAMLDKALADGDDIAAVRALLNLDLAELMVTADSVNAVIGSMARATARMSTPQGRSLGLLLQAGVYEGVYSNQRWICDRRQLPLLPLDTDCRLWSGEQFRARITQLVDSALAPSGAMLGEPIGRYSAVVRVDSDSQPYFTTLYDFVATRAVSLLNSSGQKSSFPGPDPRIMKIYGSLLASHQGEAAPTVNYELARLRYAESNGATGGLDSLQALYDHWRQSEWSGDVLCEYASQLLPVSDFNTRQVQWLYEMTVGNLDRFAAYRRRTSLTEIRSCLEAPSVRCSVSGTLVPGDTLRGQMTVSNMQRVKFEVYNVTHVIATGENSVKESAARRGRRVGTIDLTADGIVPFTRQLPFASIKLTAPGLYAVVPEADSPLAKADNYVSVTSCTGLSLGAATFGTEMLAAVVDPLTGQPVAGAALSVKSGRKPPVFLGQTDGEGLYRATIPADGGELGTSKGADRYGNNVWLWRSGVDNRLTPHADGYTSLPIYHPADTVECCFVLYQTGREERRVLSGKEVMMVLRNANYNPVDTVETVTDSMGRASANFVLPKDELTGNYSVQLRYASDAKSANSCGSVSFMVSDYKMPEYELEVDPVAIGYPSAGSATVSGRVATYSGFPLAGCRIEATVSSGRMSPWWWMRAENPTDFFTDQLTTGADGRFELVLPDSLLRSAPVPSGLFTVSLQSVSPSGESHDSQCTFTLGPAWRISCAVDRAVDKACEAELGLSVVDSRNRQCDKPVMASLISETDSTVAWSGRLLPGNLHLDWRTVPSGSYKLQLAPDGYSADTVRIDEVVLYDRHDRRSPVTAPLWTPSDRVIPTGDRAEVLYATSAPKTRVLAIISGCNGIESQRWITVGPGMHTIKVEAADSSDVTLVLATTLNYRSQHVDVAVAPRRPEPKLQIGFETFRDRVLPGAPERWTLRVTLPGDRPAQAAMIARLYNKALAQIYNLPWQWSPRTPSQLSLALNLPSYGNITEQYGNDSGRSYWTGIATSPDWLTWGYPLYTVRMAKMRNMSMKAANSVVSADGAVVEEAEVESYASAMTLGSKAIDADDDSTADSGAAISDKPQEADGFSYRDSDVPMAFFMPMLTTNANGVTSIEFTVPDANTTWMFDCLAYMADLVGCRDSREVIASKPVMVAPNLPRFVRRGDIADIAALVMNNTDSLLTVDTRVEIFNPATGAILSAVEQTDTMEAGQSATVEARLNASEPGSMIGYRVRSSASGYADGEQALIAVLPGVTQVVESTPFYISPDSARFAMPLPTPRPGARVDLRICSNPLWYVVTALPGLSQAAMSTPADAAGAIYAASVASGLLRDYPAIAEALDWWRSAGAGRDSMLVSMLERNSDLKTFLLQATPWVGAAASDSERMARLALLLDSRQINSTVDAAVALLDRLASGTGDGWRWIAQCDQPSLWATEQALSVLSQLEWLGYMPDNKHLRQLVAAAVDYADREEADLSRRYPDRQCLDFVFWRNRFKSYPQPSAVAAITACEVQRAVGEWKKYGLMDKGIAAILLCDNGYQKLSQQVLASLDQFAVSTPERGMWWPSLADTWWGSYNNLSITALLLEAYWTAAPGCRQIDAIRQWLIMQKEARNWGSGLPATTVVADLLRTSSSWIEAARLPEISVAGVRIEPDSVERYTGSFSADVSSAAATGGVLEVCEGGHTPVWGALMSCYQAPTADVEAHSCDAVSIVKNLYVARSDGNAERWGAADRLCVGDKVRVELLVTATQTIDYVAITDDRPACFEPVEQLPKPVWSEGICFYRENRDSSTNIFVTRMPKGSYRIVYDMWVNNAGDFISGVATLQSQYAPQLTAHSSGSSLTVE